MRTGVIVMAYGTPQSAADVEPYYTHIRRGRPPSEEQLADLRRRYDAIGGTSPLRAITAAQTNRLAAALGDDFVVTLGNKHARPFIEDGVKELLHAGVDRIVGVVLAPHYSRGSIGEYSARVDLAASNKVPATTVPRWHQLPEWRSMQARAIHDALASLPSRTKILFTAHSLPERVLTGDSYPDELHESAAAIAAEAGLAQWAGWGLAWQSAGRTPDPWRGPDILDVITELADTGHADGVLVCPQGFTADHLEVLYDLDIGARARAEEHGLSFARTRSVNDNPVVLGALADLVRETAKQ